jgi:hypothetical protein
MMMTRYERLLTRYLRGREADLARMRQLLGLFNTLCDR